MLGFEQAGFEQAPDLQAGMSGLAPDYRALVDQPGEDRDPVARPPFRRGFRQRGLDLV
jgi:hypothetical protein